MEIHNAIDISVRILLGTIVWCTAVLAGMVHTYMMLDPPGRRHGGLGIYFWIFAVLSFAGFIASALH